MRWAALALLTSPAWSQAIVLTGCTVIDPSKGSSVPRSNIVISGERITARGPAASTHIPRNARIVPCSGKFVIPGLWDMHVHVGEIEEDWFPLYLANGVTGLREMAASAKNFPRQRRYQDDVAAGRRSGPELFSTLFPMDTPPIASVRDAREEVARRAAMGLKYIKVSSELSRAAYFAIADECRRRGLQLTGHVPDSISVREAAAAGQDSVEHLDGVMLACSRNEDEARWRLRANRYPWKMLADNFDLDKTGKLIGELRENGVWQTPTLAIHQVATLAREGKLPAGFRTEYARRDYANAWPREALEFFLPGLDAETARSVFALHRDIVRRMEKGGVRILAGTDTPNPYCIPGFALHEELALLVESGLPPIAALRASTSNPAEFLGLTRDFGSIEPGKIADLVLLDADPLAAITNTSRIHMVFRRGRLIDSAARRGMLDRVRASVASQTTPPAAPRQD